jgi:hypothetical protein
MEELDDEDLEYKEAQKRYWESQTKVNQIIIDQNSPPVEHVDQISGIGFLIIIIMIVLFIIFVLYTLWNNFSTPHTGWA